MTGLALVAVVAGIGFWSWQRGANERHVRSLVGLAYEYSGYNGDTPDGLVYDRETFGPNGCSPELKNSEKWRGETGDNWGFEGGPGIAAAETAASRFDAEGWDVTRWEKQSSLGDTHRVTADRDEDSILLLFQNDGVNVAVSSGPCNRFIERRDPTPATEWTEVDKFE